MDACMCITSICIIGFMDVVAWTNHVILIALSRAGNVIMVSLGRIKWKREWMCVCELIK